jgi:hypothetical protein
MIEQLATNYLFVTLALICVYAVGHIAVSLFQHPGGERYFFFKLVSGLVIIATGYALVKTGGATVFSINLIALVFFLFYNKNYATSITQNLLKCDKHLIPALLVLSVFFLFNLSQMHHLADGGIKHLHIDIPYYARLAGFLRDFGYENDIVDYFMPISGTLPYNYFNIWLTAFFSEVFNNHTQYTIQLITYPIIATVVFFGGLAIVRELKKENRLTLHLMDYGVTASLFLLTLFPFLFPSWLLDFNTYPVPLWGKEKLLTIAMFLLVTFLIINSKHYRYLALIAIVMASSYTATAMTIFMGIGILYLYLLISKQNTLKSTIWNLIPLIISAVCFYAFYKFLGADLNGNRNVEPQEQLHYFFSLANLKTIINIYGGTAIQIITTIAPYLILSLFAYRFLLKHKKNLLVSFMILVFTSILSWVLMHRMYTSDGLWHNFYLPLSSIIAFYLSIAALYYKRTIYIKALFAGLVALSIFLWNPFNSFISHSQIHTDNINITNIDLNANFAYIKNTEDYGEETPQDIEQLYIGQTHNLMRQVDPLKIVCLSVHNMPPRQHITSFLENGTFMRYVHQLKQRQNFISISEAQIQFIKAFGIHYLLLKRGRPLPDHLKQYFQEKAIGNIDGYNVFTKS